MERAHDASGAGAERSAKPSISQPCPLSRRVPALIAMRDRMRAEGKASKTILIAIARQLLVILNAMIQKGQPLQIT